MRKFLSILLVLILVLSLSAVAFAAGTDKTAALSQTAFVMDGKTVTFDNAYEIEDSNYIQLRSVAKMLSGTKSQFNVYWDEELREAVIETGVAYTGVKPTVSEEPVYGIGDKVSMKGVELTITNTFTTETMPGGFVSNLGEIYYAVSFTVLTSNQPKYTQYWTPCDFISYISTDKGAIISSFHQPEETNIYPNQSVSGTIYYIIKQTDQIASVSIRDSQGTTKTILVY